MNDDLFKKLTVLGAGTMGQGIAHVCAAAGMQTVLYDVDLSTVERGLERIRARLDKGVSLGKVTEDDREATLDRITRSSDLALAVEGTPFVIEAAPESMELKQRLFRMVEQRVGEDTILATNTSSISISQLSTGMEFPARFLGMHFFNPVHIMDLVEIVWGEHTAESTRDLALEFTRLIGKEPIVVRDSPGFASSRLGIVLGLHPHGRGGSRGAGGHRQSDGARISPPHGSPQTHRPRRPGRPTGHRRISAEGVEFRFVSAT